MYPHHHHHDREHLFVRFHFRSAQRPWSCGRIIVIQPTDDAVLPPKKRSSVEPYQKAFRSGMYSMPFPSCQAFDPSTGRGSRFRMET